MGLQHLDVGPVQHPAPQFLGHPPGLDISARHGDLPVEQGPFFQVGRRRPMWNRCATSPLW